MRWCCCCLEDAGESPPAPQSLKMVLVAEVSDSPAMPFCTVCTAESNQRICAATALFYTSSNAPAVLLEHIEVPFLLLDCETDSNKLYCVLAAADGGPGASVGIVHVSAQDTVLVSILTHPP